MEMGGVASAVGVSVVLLIWQPEFDAPAGLSFIPFSLHGEYNWAGLAVCNCRHTGNWCGTQALDQTR